MAAPRPPEISVVVPAFNAGTNLLGTLDDLAAALGATGWPCEIIVVDDGSTDDSVHWAATVLDAPSNVTVTELTHLRNKGKGAALRTGMTAAAGAWVGFVDADGDIAASTVVSYVGQAARCGADVVVASKRHHESSVLVPTWRKLASWAFQALTSLVVPTGVKDTQAGAKMFERSVLFDCIERCHEDRFLFDLELLWWLRRSGARLVEAPVTVTMTSDSTVSLRDVWAMTVGTLRLGITLRFGQGRSPAAPERTSAPESSTSR